MIVADMDVLPQSVAGWVTFVVAVSGVFGGAVVWLRNARKEARKDTIGEWQAIVERQDVRIKELENQRKTYREIAEEALEVTEREVNTKRIGAGKQPFTPLVPVVAEHESPVTLEKQEAADIQTARARITAVKVALDLPPREAGQPETEGQRKERLDSEKGPSIKDEADAMSTVAIQQLKKELPGKVAEKVVEKLDEREGKP